MKNLSFFKLLINGNVELVVIPRLDYKNVIENVIKKTLMTQSISKVLRSDKFNLDILCMIC